MPEETTEEIARRYGISEAQLMRMLNSEQKRKEYSRNYYYKRKHGTSMEDVREKLQVLELRGEKFFFGATVSPGKVMFTDNNTRNGEEGWYREDRGVYQHVRWFDELMEREPQIQNELWRLMWHNPSSQHISLERQSLLDAIRVMFVIMCTAVTEHIIYTRDLPNMTVAELLQVAYKEHPTTLYNSPPYAEETWRLYFERINFMEVNYYEGFDANVSDVFAAGREQIAEFVRQEGARLERAKWLRERVAEEFGFKYDAPRKQYVRGKVTVGLDAQVHVEGSYICVVPRGGDHGHKGYPTDDIVAAKMITLGTSARDTISTLRGHVGYLRQLFDGKKEKL